MKAMVLSAGYGTRLGDLTQEIPKPMLRIGDRPLLAYIIGNLARHGFDQIAINLHFMPEQITDYFGDGASMGVELVYSHEPTLMGTAGGVKRMAEYLGSREAFCVHYGDILTDQDITAMLHFHRARGALATLLLHRRARSNSIVEMDAGGRITNFLERPDEATRQAWRAQRKDASAWVNSGVCICGTKFLDHIPEGVACDLPRDIFPKLVESERLFGFPLTGYRCAIDSPARLDEARAAVAEGRYRGWR